MPHREFKSSFLFKNQSNQKYIHLCVCVPLSPSISIVILQSAFGVITSKADFVCGPLRFTTDCLVNIVAIRRVGGVIGRGARMKESGATESRGERKREREREREINARERGWQPHSG